VSSKNRERRKAKQKARPAGGSVFGLTEERGRPAEQRVHPADVVVRLVNDSLVALYAKDEATAQRRCAMLADGSGGTGGPRSVDAALTMLLQRMLTLLWQQGWQPADVFRLVQRRHGARHGRLAVDVIAAEMRVYGAATVDERWEAQLGELGATVWWERDDQFLSAFGEREGLDRTALIRCVLEVMFVFNSCPAVQKLCPPPGKARRGSLVATAAQGHARQLDRVRALLAKAESTSFAEEAETYSAKAQELMARYSIDYALLSAGAARHDEPAGRRIGIDNPYEAQKSLLLGAVAGANRCRTVWSEDLGFVTVLGFPFDLDGVELLFTSLLVQATGAMVAAGSRRDAYGRSSTRSFRQSFLTAYAQRIGERLTAATEDVTEQAGRDAADRPAAKGLLPVLASREAKVGAFVDEIFSGLVSKPVTVSNREGWESGRAAADRAHLNARRSIATES